MFSYLNKIVTGDCLEFMAQLPSGCVDLVVTSPPYNLLNSSGHGMNRSTGSGRWCNAALSNGYAAHCDNMPHADYVKWQRSCLEEMMRVVADNGAIFYNHKWRVQDGLIQNREDIVSGFPVRQIIIWKRSGGINFNDNYFLPTYEVIYLIAKKGFKLMPRANALTDVWEVRQEAKNEHPAPFPLELPLRCIKSTDAKVILDPFMGSGTTALAARQLGRSYIGCDNSEQYVAMAEERLRNDNFLWDV
jgi:site-specific DNA-methyltransferase (adenine-specific)